MTRGNGGKSPGTQVQHTLSIGTKGTEFRRFLASKCGTVRAITKSARGFAPIAAFATNDGLRCDRERGTEAAGPRLEDGPGTGGMIDATELLDVRLSVDGTCL